MIKLTILAIIISKLQYQNCNSFVSNKVKRKTSFAQCSEVKIVMCMDCARRAPTHFCLTKH